jgi:prevent-host-death family protein
MQLQTISKSRFKAKALEYMRLVERHQRPLLITDMGNPVIQIVPYEQAKQSEVKPLHALRGTLLDYQSPTEPVAQDEWEVLR